MRSRAGTQSHDSSTAPLRRRLAAGTASIIVALGAAGIAAPAAQAAGPATIDRVAVSVSASASAGVSTEKPTPDDLARSNVLVKSRGGKGETPVVVVTVKSKAKAAPTGEVFLYTDVTLLGQGELVDGTVTFTLPGLTPGQYPLDALYTGDAVTSASGGTLLLKVR